MKKTSILILFSLIIPFLTFKPMAQQIIENRFRNGVKKEIVQTAARRVRARVRASQRRHSFRRGMEPQ